MRLSRIRPGIVAVSLMAAPQSAAQVPAQPGKAVPLGPLTVTQLDDRSQSDLDNLRPVSITLSEATPITDLLVMLVRGTRLSVVPDPDVAGVFRGELKDVTVRQALEMILQPQGFDYSMRGSVIRVFKRQLATRRFDLNYVATNRSSTRTFAAATAIATGRPRAGVEATATDQSDVFADVAAGLRTLLSPNGRFNLDRKAALLQVTDYPERLDQIQAYLDAVQNRSTRQVQIQAKVIEVALKDEFSGGVDWMRLAEQAGDAAALSQPTPAGAGPSPIVLRIRNFTGLMNAFAFQGQVRVVASPIVNALNNEPAMMRIGTQDVFFRTTTQTDATSGVLQTTVEPDAITAGVVLSVTPQIGSDGTINMSVRPSYTERTGQAISRFGDVVPVLSVREADTLVRVRQSETVVIGGLIDDRPDRGKTDLVILLTPTVITPVR